MDTITKTCKKCLKNLPFDHFHLNKGHKFGRQSLCKICRSIFTDKNKIKIRHKKYYKELKLKVFNHYTNNNIHCQCPSNKCHETAFEFMSIDHINGGGNKHRKSIHPKDIYRWLIKNKFPSGYRILCMNCNHSFGRSGYCPHSKIE